MKLKNFVIEALKFVRYAVAKKPMPLGTFSLMDYDPKTEHAETTVLRVYLKDLEVPYKLVSENGEYKLYTTPGFWTLEPWNIQLLVAGMFGDINTSKYNVTKWDFTNLVMDRFWVLGKLMCATSLEGLSDKDVDYICQNPTNCPEELRGHQFYMSGMSASGQEFYMNPERTGFDMVRDGLIFAVDPDNDRPWQIHHLPGVNKVDNESAMNKVS